MVTLFGTSRLGPVSTAVSALISLLTVLVIARILLSWFRPRYRTRQNTWFYKIDDLIWRVTEPLLGPIRNILPMGAGIDFSPMILLILVRFLGGFVISALVSVGL